MGMEFYETAGTIDNTASGSSWMKMQKRKNGC